MERPILYKECVILYIFVIWEKEFGCVTDATQI